jgi:glycosyltransferase involved in cell wall biosynthesis
MDTFAESPLISVVMPTYETEPRYLREAIASVRAQQYENWELCIVDDGSNRAETRRTIKRAVSRDPRITARLLDENGGISNASNQGLALCRGELVAFLDHDDTLTADALLRVAQTFADDEIDVAYSDQDTITADGRTADTFLKPDWSPVYALGAMYIGHLLVARRELVEEVGGFDPSFDTIQDFELLLRLSERTDRIHHIPHVLYHWRAIPGSIALGTSEKDGVPELQARAVNAHLRRRRIAAEAVPHGTIPHRVRLRPSRSQAKPAVSVVMPVRDGADRALDALLERTAYPGVEVIVVARDWSGAPRLDRPGIVRVAAPEGSFNPGGWANLGARHARGEYVAFLGEDTEVVESDWIDQLLLYAALPSVGAVGPALIHPDGRVDAAGYAVGLYDPAVPAMRGFDADGDGYYGSLCCAREVSAIGMECMLIRRALFEQLGGFEEAFSRQFGDLDLCMRLAQRGLPAVCAPAPRTVTRTTEARRLSDFDVIDRALFVDRWYELLEAGDPYYNRNFFLAAADFALSPFSRDPHAIAKREAVG